MENQRSPLLSWPYYYQVKSMEELRQSLLYTTMELETTRVTAQEEIRKREEQLTHVKELLNRAISERDEALQKCQSLLLEKLILQQQKQSPPQIHSGVSSIEFEQEPIKKTIESNNGFSSSDSEDSIISSPPKDSVFSASPAGLPENALRLISGKKSLPEKGKLLEAVMKAGPLLQTLLLAGPLPQWRHPPPPLEAFEIPPVSIPAISSPEVTQKEQLLINVSSSNCGAFNRKRGYFGGDNWGDSSSPEAKKYHRLILH